MMGVYIKGMDMPIIEMEWTIRHGADGKWYAIDTNAETSDGEWHEIIPVPPHGRLIDADALQVDMMEMVASGMYGEEDCIDAVIEAPTIIEAEEVE